MDHPFYAIFQLLNRLFLPRQRWFVPLLRHTYWINPGDAVLATTTTWALSSDIVSVGPAQWPTPEKARMKKGLRR